MFRVALENLIERLFPRFPALAVVNECHPLTNRNLLDIFNYHVLAVAVPKFRRTATRRHMRRMDPYYMQPSIQRQDLVNCLKCGYAHPVDILCVKCFEKHRLRIESVRQTMGLYEDKNFLARARKQLDKYDVTEENKENDADAYMQKTFKVYNNDEEPKQFKFDVKEKEKWSGYVNKHEHHKAMWFSSQLLPYGGNEND